jgi:hypothetical protein
MTGGFDPRRFTVAPLQTEGVVRFTGPPDAVFARVADHPAMTEWVPLLKTVQVTQPRPLPPGQSMIGTIRVLALMGVQPDGDGGGGSFVFREYFRVDGALRRFLVSRGIVMLGTRALRNLSSLIGGTSADFRQAQVPNAEQPNPVRGSSGGG